MRRVSIWMTGTMALLLCLTMMAGCNAKGSGSNTKYAGTFTDDLGRQVNLEGVPQRLVSISPACTEILFALGLGDKVVGDTKYCDHPEEAKTLPKVGTFTTPSLEAIMALAPDLVLATGGLQADLVGRMESMGLKVFVVNPATFDETVETIRRVGGITGTQREADEIAADMNARASGIEASVKAQASSVKAAPKVFYEIFYENNVWTAGSGSIISDLVKRAGGSNMGDAESSDYYEFSVERLIADNPDVYLVGSGSMASPGDITTRSDWSTINAIRDGRVYVIEEDLVYRTGPRLIDGLEAIYEAINK